VPRIPARAKIKKSLLLLLACLLLTLFAGPGVLGSLWSNLAAVSLNRCTSVGCEASENIDFFLTQSMAVHPAGVSPRYIMGLLSIRRGEHEQAIQQLEDFKSSELSGNREDIIAYWLGQEYGVTGDQKSQIRAWGSSARLFDTLLQFAQIKIQDEEWDVAVLALERLEQMEPQNPTAYIMRGFIYQKLNDLEKAEAALLQAVEVSPGNMQPYLSLANFYYSLSDYEKAEPLYQIAITKAPGNPRPYFFRGRSYLVQGKVEAGCEYVEHALQLDPTNMMYKDWMEGHCTSYEE
jgi:tetratricopeptide (TPR) repeat protein